MLLWLWVHTQISKFFLLLFGLFQVTGVRNSIYKANVKWNEDGMDIWWLEFLYNQITITKWGPHHHNITALSCWACTLLQRNKFLIRRYYVCIFLMYPRVYCLRSLRRAKKNYYTHYIRNHVCDERTPCHALMMGVYSWSTVLWAFSSAVFCKRLIITLLILTTVPLRLCMKYSTIISIILNPYDKHPLLIKHFYHPR